MATSNLDLDISLFALSKQEQMIRVCKFLGLPGEGWSLVDGQIACSSLTWTHQDWILQRRTRSRYRRMQTIYQASLGLDGVLPGFRYHGPLVKFEDNQPVATNERWLGAEFFWIAQPRLEGQVMFGLEHSPAQILDNLRLAAPKVAQDLAWLAEQKLDLDELCKTLPSHGLVQQNTSMQVLKQSMVIVDQQLRSIAENMGYAEPGSQAMLSHGDPTLKNLVRTPDGPQLIDWESVWLLPRHRDFTHQVAFLCKYLPGEYWQEAMRIVWNSAKEQLPGWNWQQWQQACVWQILREAIFFPPSPETRQGFMQALSQAAGQA